VEEDKCPARVECYSSTSQAQDLYVLFGDHDSEHVINSRVPRLSRLFRKNSFSVILLCHNYGVV
jgi:hypothetical protein